MSDGAKNGSSSGWPAIARDTAFAHLPATPAQMPDVPEGIRERKKRLMRQLISDTATAMFLERGFDEVKVAEVAAACDVSEKTVYNYFPTKESLVLDQEEAMTEAIRLALGRENGRRSPVEATVALIIEHVRHAFDDWVGREGGLDVSVLRRFSELVESTPALRAAHQEMMTRLAEVAATTMAERAGVDPEDPEPQIAAEAILGLWRVQFRAMHRYADGSLPPAEIRDRVINSVVRAARLIDTGLWSFGMAVQGADGRDQLRAAAESANEARKQVLAALKQAREAWRMLKEAQHRDDGGAGRRDQRM